MFLRKYFLFIYFLFGFSWVLAQENQLIDSLQNQLKRSDLSDSSRMELLSSLARSYQNIAPENSLKFIQQGLELEKNSPQQTKKAEFLALLGHFNFMMGDYPKALEYILQALKIDENANNKEGIARDFNGLGMIYDSKGEFDKALSYYQKILLIDNERKDSTKLSITLNNIGVIYQKRNELRTALDYFLRGLEVADKQNNKLQIGVSLNNIGDVYYSAGQYKESARFQFQALAIEKEIQDKEGIAYSFNALAKAYLGLNKFDSAEYFGLQALRLNHQLKFKPPIKDNYQTLKDIAFKKGDFKKAFLYADSTITMIDSLFSEDKNKLINQLQQNFELDKKQAEIESLQKDNIIKEQKIENQTLWRNLWIVSFGVAFAFILILVYYNWQRKRINEKLNLKNKELKNLNATKDKLFSIVSHDLRSPFNTLKSILELMKENAFSPKEIELVSSQLQQNVESISYTLDNLLQWSISQMKGEHTNIEKVNLNEIISETVNFYNEVAKQKEIQLVTLTAPNVYVNADKNQLRLIMRNLVNNALKFSFPQGKISITTQLKNREAEVAIKDTGIGMNEEQIKKLFLPTNRSTTGTSGEKGTGLGLLLSKEFIEGNGGKIIVQSKPNQGSTFTFFLKLA